MVRIKNDFSISNFSNHSQSSSKIYLHSNLCIFSVFSKVFNWETNNIFLASLTISLCSWNFNSLCLSNLHTNNSCVEPSNHLTSSNLERKSLWVVSIWIIFSACLSHRLNTRIKYFTVIKSSNIVYCNCITTFYSFRLNILICWSEIVFNCLFCCHSISCTKR